MENVMINLICRTVWKIYEVKGLVDYFGRLIEEEILKKEVALKSESRLLLFSFDHQFLYRPLRYVMDIVLISVVGGISIDSLYKFHFLIGFP